MIDPEQWTDAQVFEAFAKQVRARFEAENAAWRAQETAELGKILATRTERQDWMVVRDSFLWEVFEGCEMTYSLNMAMITLPDEFAHFATTVKMFDDTSVAWAHPRITAVGDRVVLEVLLVDYWSDEREAEWLAALANIEHPKEAVE